MCQTRAGTDRPVSVGTVLGKKLTRKSFIEIKTLFLKDKRHKFVVFILDVG